MLIIELSRSSLPPAQRPCEDNLSPPLDKPAYVPCPPHLPSPQEHATSECRLLACMEMFCSVKDSLLDNVSKRLEGAKLSAEELSSALLLKLKEAAEKAKSCNVWNMLKKVADTLLSAFSFLFGISILSSKGSVLVGGALVAAGALSFTNTILSECKGWDWISSQLISDDEEKRQKLAAFLPLAVGVIACGCGLVGSVYGIATHTLSASQQASLLAQTVLSLFNTTIQLGKGWADAKLTWAQAEVAHLETQTQTEKQKQQVLTHALTSFLGQFETLFQLAKKALASIISQSEIGVSPL